MILHHRFDGPLDAPLLVLGPSLGTSLEVWAPQLPVLAARWRVLRYDLPGHGGSPAASGFTMADLASAVLGLAGRPEFGYAGISMGGAVGVTLAALWPERVAALAVCCGSARFGSPGGWHERAALVRSAGTGALVPAAAGRWFTPAFPDPGPYLEMLRAADPEGYAGCCEALAGYDARDLLATIKAPTLVVAGADDPATPVEHSRILAGGIPSARLVVVPEAAHLAGVERPAQVTEALVAHLATVTWEGNP